MVFKIFSKSLFVFFISDALFFINSYYFIKSSLLQVDGENTLVLFIVNSKLLSQMLVENIPSSFLSPPYIISWIN